MASLTIRKLNSLKTEGRQSNEGNGDSESDYHHEHRARKCLNPQLFPFLPLLPFTDMSLLAVVNYMRANVPPWITLFVPGQTPFSTDLSVAATLVAYLSAVFSIRALLVDQKPYKLNTLFRIHNAVLSLGSFTLLVLMLQEIAPVLLRHGSFYAFCSAGAYTPLMEAYYIANYFFKYLELFDTIFLALKKKPLTFLHVFHHSATVVLCYIQLKGRTSISWAIISLNLMVHVAMYYYYYASAGGVKIWWKKHLTSMQIAQFLIDLCLVYSGTYVGVAYRYFPALPNPGDCAGSLGAALSGCAVLTSYLFLFISFYLKTYKKPAGGSKLGGEKARLMMGNGNNSI